MRYSSLLPRAKRTTGRTGKAERSMAAEQQKPTGGTGFLHRPAIPYHRRSDTAGRQAEHDQYRPLRLHAQTHQRIYYRIQQQRSAQPYLCHPGILGRMQENS